MWARTGSGKSIALDAEPNPDGNVELNLNTDHWPDGLGRYTAKVWGSSHEWRGRLRYTQHTCPTRKLEPGDPLVAVSRADLLVVMDEDAHPIQGEAARHRLRATLAKQTARS